MESSAHLVAIKSVIAPLYDPVEIMDFYYPPQTSSEQMNTLAKKSAHLSGIHNRSTVLDLAALPEKRLVNSASSSEEWGKHLIREIVNGCGIAFDDIGFLSVSYNISSHQNVLPNLACQIAQNLDLNLNSIPEVLPYLGCAGGIFSIKSAFEYCKKNDRAAVVFVFDQCTWAGNPIYDKEDNNFKKSLRANLLFNDGGIALLIVPDILLPKINSDTAFKILDVNVGHSPGNSIRMEGAKFLVGDSVADIMPELVSSRSIRPLLQNNQLSVENIDEWSIHQGGSKVLDMFKKNEILGLTEKDIEMSMKLFQKFGNFSSPSCLFVLEQFFNSKRSYPAAGVVVGFGAGYYYGSLLYERIGLKAS